MVEESSIRFVKLKNEKWNEITELSIEGDMRLFKSVFILFIYLFGET